MGFLRCSKYFLLSTAVGLRGVLCGVSDVGRMARLGLTYILAAWMGDGLGLRRHVKSHIVVQRHHFLGAQILQALSRKKHTIGGLWVCMQRSTIHKGRADGGVQRVDGAARRLASLYGRSG